MGRRETTLKRRIREIEQKHDFNLKRTWKHKRERWKCFCHFLASPISLTFIKWQMISLIKQKHFLFLHILLLSICSLSSILFHLLPYTPTSHHTHYIHTSFILNRTISLLFFLSSLLYFFLFVLFLSLISHFKGGLWQQHLW